jgi:hypothetical protein
MSQSPLQIKIISILIIYPAIIIRSGEYRAQKVSKNSTVSRKLIKVNLATEVKVLMRKKKYHIASRTHFKTDVELAHLSHNQSYQLKAKEGLLVQRFDIKFYQLNDSC